MAKKEKEKQSIGWQEIVLIVLVILFILFIFGFFDNYDKECVDDCVVDLESCAYSTDSFYTCVDCAYDLDSCIRWCDS